MYICQESRRQVARAVCVTAETPRTLWFRNIEISTGSGRSTMNPAGKGIGDRTALTAPKVTSTTAATIREKLSGGLLSGWEHSVIARPSQFPSAGHGRRCVRAKDVRPGKIRHEDIPCRTENGHPTPSVKEGGGNTACESREDSSRRGQQVVDEGEAGSMAIAHEGVIAMDLSAAISSAPAVERSTTHTPNTCRISDNGSSVIVDEAPADIATTTASKDLDLSCTTASSSKTPPFSGAKEGIITSERIPSARVTGIVWQLAVTELLAPRFGWPVGVKKIRFWGKFADAITGVVFPETLESLIFGFAFNQSLEPGRVQWPHGLKCLHFGARWNRRLRGAAESWPALLEELHFGTGFDKPLSGNGAGLPPGLQVLSLGSSFDQPLAGVEWPRGLQKLVLSDHFNQSLDSIDGVRLPGALKEIVLGRQYNQEITGVAWPEGLQKLTFGFEFNQALVPASHGTGRGVIVGSAGDSRSFALPAALKVLVLGHKFDQPLGGFVLPERLEQLTVGERLRLFDMAVFSLPSRLKRLSISCKWGPGRNVDETGLVLLPASLEYLDVGPYFNSSLDMLILPAELKVLILGFRFNQPILAAAREQVSDQGGEEEGWRLPPQASPLLPDGLEELRLGSAFCQDINTGVSLPTALKRLIFSPDCLFNGSVTGVVWPAGLEMLEFGNRFNQPMERKDEPAFFPETLRQLHFGWTFAYSLQGIHLPDSLREVSFPAVYPLSHIMGLEWPTSLRCVRVGCFTFSSRAALAKCKIGQPPF